jgi:putative Mn2+ efflux pump MntP
MRAVSNLQKLFWAGGLVAGVLLIVAGALWIWQGVDGRNEVQATISREQIVGTPDMNPEEIRAGIAESGVEIDDIPTCDVADEPITTGDEARCFAEYMRVHALEGTGGKTFSQMGRFLDEEGNEAFSEEDAAKDPKTGAPVSNPARETWITQRALATGLELSFVGEQVSVFAIATGALFVVIGIGLLVMLLVGGVLGNPFERRAGPS